jgi:peptide/nickel transport system substrate-binding protein
MKLRSILLGASALTMAATAGLAERGADGQLNILYWQAVSTLNPFLSGGTKDIDAAALVLEPLARFDNSGQMVPYLAESIPTLENGGISEDLTSITWKLKPGLLWSDGTAVTANDAVFTWKYCTDPAGGCAQISNFGDVTNVEAVDDLTIKITFGVPKPYPYGPLVGAQSPILQAAQFANCLGAAAPTCADANTKPIGTGPFMVTDFKADDVVTYAANPNYRDPAKPAFATVVFKGGGDAAAAARAVLETGEFDYSWNLQVEPEILAGMAAAGKGEVISAFGTLVERIHVNLTDPSPDLPEGERSTAAHPNPWFALAGQPDGTRIASPVVKALSMALDRQILVDTGYGAAGQVTCNLVPAPEYNASTGNDWCKTPDIEGAKAILEAEGWVVGADGIREKDGQRLSILYQTSTNSVRQAAQALIKQFWQEIGVETELRNIEAGVYFSSDAASPDTLEKFYAHVEMFANNFDGTDAEKYLGDYVCEQDPGPDSQWQGANTARYCNPAFDALHGELAKTAGQDARAALIKQLNDMIVNEAGFIPLVHRGRVSGRSMALNGVVMNAWDSEMWNVGDWSRAK